MHLKLYCSDLLSQKLYPVVEVDVFREVVRRVIPFFGHCNGMKRDMIFKIPYTPLHSPVECSFSKLKLINVS